MFLDVILIISSWSLLTISVARRVSYTDWHRPSLSIPYVRWNYLDWLRSARTSLWEWSQSSQISMKVGEMAISFIILYQLTYTDCFVFFNNTNYTIIIITITTTYTILLLLFLPQLHYLSRKWKPIIHV